MPALTEISSPVTRPRVLASASVKQIPDSLIGTPTELDLTGGRALQREPNLLRRLPSALHGSIELFD
jgi:hypothetical protein